MVYLMNHPLSTYTSSDDGTPSAGKARRVWEEYICKLCGAYTPKEEHTVTFSVTATDADRLTVSSDRLGNLHFSGGRRGIIYGVFAFFEKKCGCRFYTNEVEKIPEGDIRIQRVAISETSVIRFREILGNASDTAEDMIRYRLNSNAWHKRLTEEYGGGMRFAGVPAHSLTCDFLLKPYAETHPEYFCLIDGKRVVDRFSQVCFSAPGMVEATIHEVLALLEKNPDADFVSVSQADSDHYCECEECQKKYRDYSKTELFLQIVNRVADAVRMEYPKVLIHTFAYNKTCSAPKKVIPRDNVTIQYCIGSCKNHRFSDLQCPTNRKARRDFERWTENYSNVIIWDYPNCFKYQMVNRPDIGRFRKNISYFVKHNVRGMFFEFIHRKGDGSCVFSELKTYLLAKLMWNPAMASDEYKRLTEDFLAGYYGAAGPTLGRYLELWETSVDPSVHYSYDLYNAAHSDDAEIKPVFDLVCREQQDAFFCEGYRLWEEALSAVSGEVAERVKKEYVGFLYLDSLLRYDRIMKEGTEAEKQNMKATNRALVDGIIKYNIKLTFWGQEVADQMKEMPDYYELSPREWNYRW